ncbi:hypothetical protein B0A67_10280 [Flavobacterium aquidurense]|jgi:hypothetical protein|uniref:pyocin knob domain-containing protein n=1 Tax=Flavobacterium aquidurense TaxID=362413 RepID=UPI0009184556|nr:pyocin knob domain-containing protein [Flavobacterium aquidurense]OXA71733.1 hypothetical protein B0A67_10280 [Flavobacterium aquidurense]SHH20856.1 hypothetical protein SAMN05444481_11355 [Flavobacterium frigidimaris]
MALQTLNTIKQWFKTGLKPTQTQFWDTWDSFRHKFDKIPVKEVEGLDELLLSKADKTVLDHHLADKNVHAPQVNTDWNSESGFSQLLNKPEFKTINGEPLTGDGDIIIEAGGSQNLQTTLANGNETTNGIMFNDDYYNWLKTSIDSRSIRLTDSNSDMLVAIDSAGVVTRDDSQHVSLNPQGIFFNRDTADTAESYLRINESSTGISTVNLPVTKGKEITLAATDDFKTINGESIVGEGNLDIEPQGLKSVLDADPTASYGQSKATLMGDYASSKYNEIIVSDETEKTGIYQLKNQLSFDHTVLDSNDIGNITLSEGNVILTRDKSNNQTVVDISDPVANTQLRFPAKSEEGKTYTIATTEDFKTINGESIVGSGDISVSGGAGDIPTLQQVLDKDRNATNASINLLSEDGESQTTVHEGGLNISEKTGTGFLITDINKLGVSVSKDEETTFANISADELSLNKNLSGNPVKQGIVLNEDSAGTSTIKLPLTSDGDVKTLATTEDFKTINGESIVGSGNIIIGGETATDATATAKGIVKLAGDLGGTADFPTTPTALHKTGNESWSGQKTASNFTTSLPTVLNLINNYTASASGRTFQLISAPGSSSVLMGMELQSASGGKALEIISTSTSTVKPVSIMNANTEVLSIDKLGAIVTTANVTAATPTLSGHLVTKAYADSLVVGLLDDRGSYNASVNSFPTTGGSGPGGAILKGDIWYVSVPGTLGGKTVLVGDSFRALTDSPAQLNASWSILSTNIGFVPANDANMVHKTGNVTEDIDGVKTFTGILFSTPVNTNAPAFIGTSTNSICISGKSANHYGVSGVSTSGGGVHGLSQTGTGAQGTSGSGIGTIGLSDSGIGLVASTRIGAKIASFMVNGFEKSYIDNVGRYIGGAIDINNTIANLKYRITSTNTGGHLVFENNEGAETVRVFQNGNVGIGTASSTYTGAKLQVNGTISTAGIVMNTGSDINVLFDTVPNLSQINSSTGLIDIGFGEGLTVLESFKQSSNDYGMQRITYTTGSLKGKVYVRVKDAGTWSAWTEK